MLAIDDERGKKEDEGEDRRGRAGRGGCSSPGPATQASDTPLSLTPALALSSSCSSSPSCLYVPLSRCTPGPAAPPLVLLVLSSPAPPSLAPSPPLFK